MVQEVSNGHGFSVGGKIRKEFRERLVVAKFAVVHEQHDRHSSELLGEGCEPEICMGINFRFHAEIADAVAALENGLTLRSNEHSHPRSIQRSQAGENLVQLFLRGHFWRLPVRFHSEREQRKYRNDELLLHSASSKEDAAYHSLSIGCRRSGVLE